MVMHRGNSTSVSRESRDIEGMAMKYPTVKSDSFIDSESVHLWSAFRSILGGRRVIRFRISVPPADTSSSIIETENEFEYFKPKIFADPERGVVYTSIMVGQDSYLLTERLKHLRKFAEDTSGNLVLESAPTSIKREMDVWGSLPNGFEIMRQLKEKFDPNHVLSPGRYVGGI
jgi:glycolate oxidase FAD binding subunit